MHRLERYGPVEALHVGRRLLGLGPPLMMVRCYAVDGVLVDTGLAPLAGAVLAFARERGVRRAVLTHHHEDHSGAAFALVAAGIPVAASAATRARMAAGFEIRPYQRLAWGSGPIAAVGELGAAVETDRYRFAVLPAPGHCPDQVVFHEPREGWLFSGDAYLADRVKLFRGDEDFAATVASLERLVQLDFDTLFCAHRPVVHGGRDALRRKLQWLRDLEGQVRELAARGLSLREITRRVLGREGLLWILSGGDLCKYNVVRSILHGPVPRER